MKGSTLIVFSDDLPQKNKKWWEQFDVVIAPQKPGLLSPHALFIKQEDLIDPGSVQEATFLLKKLSLLKTSKGERLSKLIMFRGFELWWIHYGDFMHRFCFPYTRYKNLLERAAISKKVYLYKPQSVELFQYYLSAHHVACEIVGETSHNNIPAIGVWIQVFLSSLFLIWAKFQKTQVMVWTSDLFDPPHDYDFRMGFIYKELRERQIKFIEFIRSLESTKKVLQHAVVRRRPVVYSAAIINVTHWLSTPFNKRYVQKIDGALDIPINPEERFWYGVATHYIRRTAGTVQSIKIMSAVLKFLEIKVANINDATSRNYHEVLACKLLHIPVVGIMHGAASQYYNVSDFMHEFDGEKSISVDVYGVWSEWWRQYYLAHSKAYKPEELVVSGPIRPLANHLQNASPLKPHVRPKVLFIAEQLGAPSETMPYLDALLTAPHISLYIKFRSYRDGFEDWLKKYRPDVLEKVGSGQTFYGNMVEAIDKCDVVVGSHSTAVLEAVLRLKPLVFYDTKKWGDYFGVGSLAGQSLFAKNPQELLYYIEHSQSITPQTIKTLQDNFFGNPYKNGSKWVVDEMVKLL